jgi:hypothetical protein
MFCTGVALLRRVQGRLAGRNGTGPAGWNSTRISARQREATLARSGLPLGREELERLFDVDHAVELERPHTKRTPGGAFLVASASEVCGREEDTPASAFARRRPGPSPSRSRRTTVAELGGAGADELLAGVTGRPVAALGLTI